VVFQIETLSKTSLGLKKQNSAALEARAKGMSGRVGGKTTEASAAGKAQEVLRSGFERPAQNYPITRLVNYPIL
jgi:hypothetical protein